MPRVLISAAGGERIAGALEWLAALQTKSEALVLAPTRGAADDLLRAAVESAGGVFGVHRTTVGQLAHELAAADLGSSGRLPLSGLSVEALVTRAIHFARDEKPLAYFEPVATMPGFPGAMALTLTELRLQDVEPAALIDGSLRARDVAMMLGRFESELQEHALADMAAVLDAATAVAETRAHRLCGLPLLILDAWPETAKACRFMSAMVAAASDVLITAPEGSPLPSSTVLGSGDDAELEEERTGAAASSLSSRRSLSSLDRARLCLFEATLGGEAVDRDDSLQFFSAPGEDRECVEIARRIHQLAGDGVAFDRIAVLLREVQGYLPLLEDALRRAGIATYFSRGATRPDPAGRAFLALLACAAEGLSAARFAEYLSLGEMAEVDASGAPPVREVPWVETEGEQLVFKSAAPGEAPPPPAEALRAPARWERLLVDASVVGGIDRWRSRLAGLACELELQEREVGDEDDARRLHLSRQLERLRTLERFAVPVIEDLHALPSTNSWGGWIGTLEKLASRVLRDPSTVLRLLGELRPMSAVQDVSLAQVRQVLRARLSFLQAEPPRHRYGRVFVGTIAEGLGRTFNTVFVPGLAEGLFPRRVGEDPLLLDQDRATLDDGLEVREARFRAERALLRWALGCGEERVVVSFPRVDLVQGRARVPSFYALDVLRAAENRLPPLDALEDSAAEGQLNWPAPEDPHTAIDDAEYDLALLAPLLRPGARSTRGRARFLLEMNPRLDRSLRSRWYRWRATWSTADGLVEPGREALDILRAQLPSARSYSPTALQTYAACPYRFLLYAIHRLRPREDLVSIEQLDPLTRGSLFHEVQYRFFVAAQEASLLPFRVDFEAPLMALVDDSLDAVAHEYEERLAPAIPRIWKGEIEALRMDLRGWVRKLLEENADWTPVHFEYAFGLAQHSRRDPSSTESEVTVLDGMRLRGSIDLVERDWKRRLLRVTDHKTGRRPTDKNLVIGKGEVLQPLIYALVAEEALAAADEVVTGGRLFYCTQRGGYESIEVALEPRHREAISGVVETIEDALLEGFLPAAPRADACRYCDYRSVCGPYEELRVGRKKKEPLAKLATLRSQA